MAGKTTKVNVGLEVDVTGTKDIDALARSMEQAAKAAGKPLEVAAQVTGTKDVAGLSTALDGLPDGPTKAAVTASVAGLDQVDTLAGHIEGLPASTSSAVTASVAGLDQVDTLAGHIDSMPATTTPSVNASTSGLSDIGDLADDIAALPASTDVKVTATVKETGGGVKQLGTDLDEVKRHAEEAGEGVSGFASETAGTLGGQFSDGIGTVADFGEQLRNLGGAYRAAGGGFKAFGGIFAGVATTIGAGLLFDQISGDIEHANALMEESKGVVSDLTTTLIDNGNQWDINTQKQLISSIQGTDTFKTLREAGASTKDLLDAFYKGDPASFGKVWSQVSAGEKAFDANTISALKAGKAMIDSGGQASDAAQLILDYEKANGLSEDTATDNAAAAGKSGDAMRDAGGDADFASQRVKTFNATPLKDKSATLSATDQVTPAVDGANRKDLHNKSSRLDATDEASPKVSSFNAMKIDGKTATVDANTQPAKDDIAALEAGKIYLDTILQFDDSQLRAAGIIMTPSMVGPDVPAASSTSSAPHLRGSVHVPVAAPIQVTVNGALDPAAVARQIRQVLIRGERRTGPIRAGGDNPLRAPV